MPGSVDAVVTDPPYEREAHTSMRRTRAMIEGRADAVGMPFDPITEDIRQFLVDESIRIANGWALVFCQAEAVGKYQEQFGDTWRRPMVWIKPDSPPQFSGDRPAMGYESICAAWCGVGKSHWNGGGKRGVFTYNCTNYKHEHPAQKPVDLISELICLFTQLGDTIIDPFMGSGTTGVACVKTGRSFIGIERDSGYFAIAQRRIAEAQLQPQLDIAPIREPNEPDEPEWKQVKIGLAKWLKEQG